jgi:5-methyltetrahydropteroyltriglutamate--homocysteine methyltransferase
METDRALPTPDATVDGGDLDCGGGLLLLIRRHLDPLAPGEVLRILSTETSVDEDLPAWCRMTSNELVHAERTGKQRTFLVAKGRLADRAATPARAPVTAAAPVVAPSAPVAAAPLVAAVAAPLPPPLAVMGIGSWPRPRWMLSALHDHVTGRLAEDAFQETANDAVRLAVAAQVRAGVDLVTDGEQRRDAYASFVGGRLASCQLIPLTDLLPLVDDPDHFRAELESLDVPAGDVRHPAVFGRLARTQPIAGHELAFARSITDRPVKVALPGPYLLARTMWLECVSDRAYASREELAGDLVAVLREEMKALLAGGASIVQLDEPVLSEVVFGAARSRRSFMCGALSERGDAERELAFARELVNAVTAGLPRERIALHMCRGNWSPDERVALAGDYAPLLPLFRALEVGTFFLELATPRAGDLAVLRGLPDDRRVGVGVVNQKLREVESAAEIEGRVRRAVDLLGKDRVLLTPDCGFATFADNPVTAATVAEAKLAAIVEAARGLR